LSLLFGEKGSGERSQARRKCGETSSSANAKYKVG
jgi:hypothetical protein